ncbi:MAG: hypothetical protein HC773_16455, partial [Scytonema sp. CRU_2_7]|nr:hypothetical protein [Scytonema sp. CRU_2_7]
MQKASWLIAEPQLQAQVVPTLWQAFYGVRERNRLERHSDGVIGVSFGPDRKTIAFRQCGQDSKAMERLMGQFAQ